MVRGSDNSRTHTEVTAASAPLFAAAGKFEESHRGLTIWIYSPTTYFEGARPVALIDDPDVLEAAFRAQEGVEW